MPLYRVTWNGQDILDYTDRQMVLLSPHLEQEVSIAGSLRFVVPPYHTFYELFTEETMLISDVEIYEDEELIWFGRPLQLKKDFFNQKEVYCEGALAYFNDSIQEKCKYDGISLHEFFRQVVANHNHQVDASRQFLIGNITVSDKTVYREPNYEKSIDVLKSQCLDTVDGYFFVRKVSGKNYIDWLAEMPYSCNQVIEFAENMLNLATSFDGNDYATCVMPLGANDDYGDPINVMDVNGGSNLIISDMAQVYGRIVQVAQFSDIEDKTELLAEGRKALERIQYNRHSIECSAADLHSRDGSKEIFRLGQMVHCYSQPHGLEIDLPLSKLELYLDTAAKHITLGIIKKKTLTRITKAKENSSESYTPESYTPESYTPESYAPDPGVIKDSNGDEWEIKPPEENGDPVTAIRMPIKITIAKPPNKTEYAPGETIDYTGISVNIWTKNKGDQEVIWTNPPRYLDGKAPFAELSFSMKTAPNQEGVEGFTVIVTWKYKNKAYTTQLQLSMVAKERVYTDGDGIFAIVVPITEEAYVMKWKYGNHFKRELDGYTNTTYHGQYYLAAKSPLMCFITQYNGNIYAACIDGNYDDLKGGYVIDTNNQDCYSFTLGTSARPGNKKFKSIGQVSDFGSTYPESTKDPNNISSNTLYEDE